MAEVPAAQIETLRPKSAACYNLISDSHRTLTQAVSFEEIVDAAKLTAKKNTESRSLDHMEYAFAYSRFGMSSTRPAASRCTDISPFQTSSGGLSQRPPSSSSSAEGVEAGTPSSAASCESPATLDLKNVSLNSGMLGRMQLSPDDCMSGGGKHLTHRSISRTESMKSDTSIADEWEHKKHDIILAWEFYQGKKKPKFRNLSVADIKSLNAESSYLFAAVVFDAKRKSKKKSEKKNSDPEASSSSSSAAAGAAAAGATPEEKDKQELVLPYSGRLLKRGLDDSSISEGSESSMPIRRGRRASFSEMQRSNPKECSWSEEIEKIVTPRGRTMPFACLPRVSDGELRRLATTPDAVPKKSSFHGNKQQRETLEHLFSHPAFKAGQSAAEFLGKKKSLSTSDDPELAKIVEEQIYPQKDIGNVIIELFLWNGLNCSKDVYMAAFAKAQLLDSSLSMPSAANAAVAWIWQNKRIRRRSSKRRDEPVTPDSPQSLSTAIRNTLLENLKNHVDVSLSMKTAILTVVRERSGKGTHHGQSGASSRPKIDGPPVWTDPAGPTKLEKSKKTRRKRKKIKDEDSSGSAKASSSSSRKRDSASAGVPAQRKPMVLQMKLMMDNSSPTNLMLAPPLLSPFSRDEDDDLMTPKRRSPTGQEAADSNHRQVASDRGNASPSSANMSAPGSVENSPELSLLSGPSPEPIDDCPASARAPEPKPVPVITVDSQSLKRRELSESTILVSSKTKSASKRPPIVSRLSLKNLNAGGEAAPPQPKQPETSTDEKKTGIKAPKLKILPTSLVPKMTFSHSVDQIHKKEKVSEGGGKGAMAGDDNEGEASGGARYFRGVLSKIEDGLFLSGDEGASKFDEMKKVNILCVVNAADRVCREHFPGKFRYYSLDLLDDGGKEDMRPLFLEVVDIIERYRRKGGATLLHCQQGISRSATLAIAYVMWKRQLPFRQALDAVTKKRSVVGPNGGFMGQLLLWESFLRSVWKGSRGVRLTRISMLTCSRHEIMFVGKEVGVTARASLDPRGCFVLHNPSQGIAYAWLGERSTEEYRKGARKYVDQLERFLGVQTAPQELQGYESATFWRVLGESSGSVSTVSQFDREYSRLEKNVLYRALAWDRIESRSRQLVEESKCQIWAYCHTIKPSSSSSPAAESSSSTTTTTTTSTTPTSKAAGAVTEAVFWIPDDFVIRAGNGIETRDPNEVLALISSAFLHAGSFPEDTICRRVTSPTELLDMKFGSTLKP